jgi:hypothetical protein
MNLPLNPAIVAQIVEAKRLLASVAPLPKMPETIYAPQLFY